MESLSMPLNPMCFYYIIITIDSRLIIVCKNSVKVFTKTPQMDQTIYCFINSINSQTIWIFLGFLIVLNTLKMP